MSNKQARLVAAIADAMAAQNFSQAGLARAAGCSQSMISTAMSGKYDLKEVKWRMICEVLALDYDDIVAPPPQLPEEPAPEMVIPVEPAVPHTGNCRQLTRRRTIKQRCARDTWQRSCERTSVPARICRWKICMCC